MGKLSWPAGRICVLFACALVRPAGQSPKKWIELRWKMINSDAIKRVEGKWRTAIALYWRCIKMGALEEEEEEEEEEGIDPVTHWRKNSAKSLCFFWLTLFSLSCSALPSLFSFYVGSDMNGDIGEKQLFKLTLSFRSMPRFF